MAGKANFPRTKASFWREIRSSAFASQYRLCSTSLSAPPSRRKQLQVDGGLRRDIEQCLTASFVPRSARCRVHCRLLRALLLRAYCQPALVACSRCAAVGRASRRLAVGNARFLPHFLQNALLVASDTVYRVRGPGGWDGQVGLQALQTHCAPKKPVAASELTSQEV